jgi:hypothetical protein
MNAWEDKEAPFCQFRFDKGFIVERQRDRVLGVGADGKPCFLKRSSSDTSQLFEIVVLPNKPVPIAEIYDGSPIDKLA